MIKTPLEVLEADALLRPDDTAFIAADDAWSYKRFAQDIDRNVAALVGQGIQNGSRVALQMRNIPQMAVLYFACFKVGAVAVPINTRLKSAELEKILIRLRPCIFMAHDELSDEAAKISNSVLTPEARFVVGASATNGSARSWDSALTGSPEPVNLSTPSPHEPAVLLCSSGTTGEPKLVAHSLETLSFSALAFKHAALENAETSGIATPMVHASGFFIFLASLYLGAKAVLFDRFDARNVLKGIEKHKISWFGGLPYMMAEIVEAQERWSFDATSLKTCFTLGDVSSAELQNDFENCFSLQLHSFWGASEAVGTLTLGSKSGPVSKIIEEDNVRVADENGKQVMRGDVGELQIRGPNLTLGYWKEPRNIETATHAGWYHTGDLVREDEDGELWFVNRKKDLIVRGGSKIWPAEVEAALLRHPAVKSAVVAGFPDPLLGQRIVGFVQLHREAAGASTEEILASARHSIADYKVPERMTIVPDIPRNAVGKIDRNLLLSRWQPDTDR